MSSIAIIGSGPAGCYTAAALRKRVPGAEVVVIDALPTPYGLIRHGIAPDHQGMKAVAQQFDRLFDQGWARFVGGVRIGTDLSMEQLAASFDAVVVATGLPEDRPLDVPGADLPGVYSAGRIARLLNAHPGADLRSAGVVPPGGLGREVAVLGTGNVAVDIVRLIAKHDSGLVGSDIDDDARALLRTQDVRIVRVLGRGSAASAKWDASMLRELSAVPTVTLTVDGTPLGDPASDGAGVAVDVHFGVRPTAIAAYGGRLALTAETAEGPSTLEFDSVITAIGFTGRMTDIPQQAGGHVFTVGGCGTGVLGNLSQNRTAAQGTATAVAAFLERSTTRRGGWNEFERLLPEQYVDWAGWRRVDAAEVDRAGTGRVRRKFTSHEEIVALGTVGRVRVDAG